MGPVYPEAPAGIWQFIPLLCKGWGQGCFGRCSTVNPALWAKIFRELELNLSGLWGQLFLKILVEKITKCVHIVELSEPEAFGWLSCTRSILDYGPITEEVAPQLRVLWSSTHIELRTINHLGTVTVRALNKIVWRVPQLNAKCIERDWECKSQ